MFRKTLFILAIYIATVANFVCSPAAGQQAETAVDTLVVCPQGFQQALQPWVNYRMQQGHKIEIILPQAAENLRKTIRTIAANNDQLETVVLVGDSTGDANTVPTNYIHAKVNVQFGGQKHIATDNRFADLDDDGVPELAIGRLTVDSTSELTAMIDRIIAYEQDAGGEWLQRINFVAGVGGFGQLIDKLIEQTAKQMITELIPAGYQTTMTYGSWTSPYCPDPSRFDEVSVSKFNEGCLFWVYIGHGATHFLDRVRLPDRSYRILDHSNTQTINSTSGSPIAVFLACNTGGFDHPTDCLAETMLKQPKGPIAVLASTRVAMPYGLSLFTLGLSQDYFSGDAKTLGELVRDAKRKLVLDDSGDLSKYRQIIEAMGQGLSPKPELLASERKEHSDLIQLLGDPLLRIKRPEKLALTSEIEQSEVSNDPDDLIRVAGQSPFDGKARVTLSYKRDRFRFRPARRGEYDPDDFASYQKSYEEAQQLVCSEQTIEIAAGDFQVDIPVPEDANGECVVQIYLQGETGYAIDSVPIQLPSN